MKTITKIGCALIGWNANLLSECGEASHAKFNKLVTAIMIMVMLWGTIGYLLAARYVGIESIPGRMGVAFAFMLAVLGIERVIVLTVGKARFMTALRVVMAVCMALAGSCIFDQMMFKNDIQEAVAAHREEVIQSTIQNRLKLFDNDIARINHSIDSISKYNDVLYKELEARPTTTVTAVSTNTIQGPNGPMKVQNVNKTVVPNPRAEQAKGNEEQLKIYNQQLEQLRLDKKDIDKSTRKEINERPLGFIEELEATIEVISHSLPSLAFYIVVFVILMSIELFVVSIKMGDTKCDYEMIVEHQLDMKRNWLTNVEKDLKR